MTNNPDTGSSSRQRLKNLPLGQRLTLYLLPIVFIPTLFIALVGFPRIRQILLEQAVNQLTNSSIEQTAYIQEWTQTETGFPLPAGRSW